jgi:hypothetical protein
VEAKPGLIRAYAGAIWHYWLLVVLTVLLGGWGIYTAIYQPVSSTVNGKPGYGAWYIDVRPLYPLWLPWVLFIAPVVAVQFLAWRDRYRHELVDQVEANESECDARVRP